MRESRLAAWRTRSRYIAPMKSTGPDLTETTTASPESTVAAPAVTEPTNAEPVVTAATDAPIEALAAAAPSAEELAANEAVTDGPEALPAADTIEPAAIQHDSAGEDGHGEEDETFPD